MKNSYKYFSNKDCEYYKSCHDGVEKNCLFCFCPLYNYKCPGDYAILKNGVKDCSKCLLPHTDKGYDEIISFLKNINYDESYI